MCIEVCGSFSDAPCGYDEAVDFDEEVGRRRPGLSVIFAVVLLLGAITAIGFASPRIALAESDAVCVDTEPLNDGWGWNGTESCRTGTVSAGVCVDTEPFDDDYGWNGVESCLLTEPEPQLNDSSNQDPTVDNQGLSDMGDIPSDSDMGDIPPGLLVGVPQETPAGGLISTNDGWGRIQPADEENPLAGPITVTTSEYPMGPAIATGQISAPVDGIFSMTISMPGEPDIDMEVDIETGVVVASTETPEGRRQVTFVPDQQDRTRGRMTVRENGVVVTDQTIDVPDERVPEFGRRLYAPPTFDGNDDGGPGGNGGQGQGTGGTHSGNGATHNGQDIPGHF